MTLRARRLTCAYGELVALRDVSVDARPGRITAVLGPNAAGKSTLLGAAIGAVRPRAGMVEVNGRPVHELRPRSLAACLAYVPQRSAVAAAFRVEEVVRLGRYALPPDERRVQGAISRLGLEDIADRPYHELSVGQQQRVTLARAVAQLGPEGHLILDEPMSAMDFAHVTDVVSLLGELARAGATIVIAMHDLPLAAAMADDVWLLRDGELVAAGAVAATLTPARLESVFNVRFSAIDAGGGRRILAPEPWMRGGGEEPPRG